MHDITYTHSVTLSLCCGGEVDVMHASLRGGLCAAKRSRYALCKWAGVKVRYVRYLGKGAGVPKEVLWVMADVTACMGCILSWSEVLAFTFNLVGP